MSSGKRHSYGKSKYNYGHSSDSGEEGHMPMLKGNDLYGKYKTNKYGYQNRKGKNHQQYMDGAYNQHVNYMSMQRRKGNMKQNRKKNYVSPYSQKAMIYKHS